MFFFTDRIRRESNSNSPVSLRNLNDTREQAAQTGTTLHVTDIQPTENSIQALCFTIQYLTRQVSFIIFPRIFLLSTFKYTKINMELFRFIQYKKIKKLLFSNFIQQTITILFSANTYG